MDEIDFKLIEVLASTKNLTRASDILNMTQSAISKRIKVIETELKASLFLRSHNGIRFTSAGEKVLEHCLRISKELSELHTFLEENEDTVYGTLNAGISDNFMTFHLPAIADSFHKKYPNVNLKFRTEKSHVLYPLLLNNQIDIAIIRGDYGWDGFKKLLSREAMCVVYNKEFENRPLSSLTYIDRSTDSFQYAMMTKWRRENSLLSDTQTIRMDSISSAIEMVRRSMGWALIPEIALDDFNGCIKPCYFRNGELFTRLTYLYCKNELVNQPQIKAFINETCSRTIRYPFGG